ncbi:MAG: hypothetical protein DMG56_16125, partial [Acidobacteria bacterium]
MYFPPPQEAAWSGGCRGHAEFKFELRLTGGDRAAVGRQARVQIAIGIRGEQAKFSFRIRNDSELSPFETGFRKRRGNQHAVPVRHPRGIEIEPFLRHCYQPLLAACSVDRDKAAEVIWRRLHHGDQNRFSIRRPS